MAAADLTLDKLEDEITTLACHIYAGAMPMRSDDANDVHAAAYVGYTWDEDGSLLVQVLLASEDGTPFSCARSRRRGTCSGSASAKKVAVPRNRDPAA